MKFHLFLVYNPYSVTLHRKVLSNKGAVTRKYQSFTHSLLRAVYNDHLNFEPLLTAILFKDQIKEYNMTETFTSRSSPLVQAKGLYGTPLFFNILNLKKNPRFLHALIQLKLKFIFK